MKEIRHFISSAAFVGVVFTHRIASAILGYCSN
jgi:hypothetical protein